MAIEAYVYWDSCVFIDAIQRSTHRFHILEETLDAAERGKVVIVSSMFTIAEVVKCEGEFAHPDILAMPEDDRDKLIKDFFENPYIHLRPVDRNVSEKAREMVKLCRIKPPDAIQLATAILHPRITHLQTFDDKTLIKPVSLVPFDLVGVTVGLPFWNGDLSLPGIITDIV